MKRSLLLLAVFLLVGCDHKDAPIPRPTPVPPVVIVVPPANPVQPVIAWVVNGTAAHAGAEVIPDKVTTRIEILSATGELLKVVRSGEHFDFGSNWGWYFVRGQVGGQWSSLTAFHLSPNPCGGCLVPPMEPPPTPTQVCVNYAEDRKRCEEWR